MKNLDLSQMENVQGGNWWDCALFIPAVLSPLDAGVLDIFFGVKCLNWLRDEGYL